MFLHASHIPVMVFLLAVGWVLGPTAGWALDSGEVAVIANEQVGDSLELADYYMQRRRIPPEHLIRLSVAANERCSRQEYDERIREPVRRALAEIDPKRRIRCLVVMYGVPLAVHPVATKLKEHLHVQDGTGVTAAAVDSELALVLADDYPLEGWLPNPYFLGFHGQATRFSRDTVLIVGRLDGPDPATVRRVIDDTLFAEKRGLRGRACFDARWPKPSSTGGLSGYAFYDASLHAAAEAVRASGRMEVRLDAQGQLFQPGQCPRTALYCGWYSLAHYVDAFGWLRGAIGYHIASAECTTLKKENSQVWCKRMLEDGVAATIGPVNEPYVEAFPPPELFFTKLLEGYLSLGETYLVSLPLLSWQMVLIGDPLYQPFAPR
ncbi:TIGR03790 family protein [Desulfobulbus elongatus]|uniref:TIGR03790 family protein n=1 Tax=Desulfobulbus elongatus TaxID=53332 RepID=UPI0005575723|nr:TIGR03790 family protein [Desulfobulbus elongatus]